MSNDGGSTKYLITGATGFIGSQVFCELTKRVGIENVVVLVRKVPDLDKSLFAKRLEANGLHDQRDKIQFVMAPFSNPELFKESLLSLVKTYGAETKWRVVHLAAIIALPSSGNSDEQLRINVGVTEDLVNWANVHAERLVFTSSVAAFGGTEVPRVRTEKDFVNFPPYCEMFSYFTTKRHAHEFVLHRAKISVAVICPGIVHGAYDSFKSSRRHLEMLRNGKLRVVPRGGSNFVGLDRVSAHVVEHAVKPVEKPTAELTDTDRTFLSVDRNMTFKEYFDLYLDIYQGAGKPKIHLLPRFLDRLLVNAHRTFSGSRFWPETLNRLPQASLFLYFNSEHPQPPTRGIDEAIRDSLNTL